MVIYPDYYDEELPGMWSSSDLIGGATDVEFGYFDDDDEDAYCDTHEVLLETCYDEHEDD
jgi:hypothetical protein